jgi:hypothetical protein
MTTDKIKAGDSVYWRKRVGMFARTLSGTVKEINKETGMASVSVQTQSIYGRIDNVDLNRLIKSKKQ